MPVIGRLDDQVEAVLINPLRRRPTHGEEERDELPRPAAPDEDAAVESPDESRRERRAGDASLPVWLL
jgi:hypothetical protein